MPHLDFSFATDPYLPIEAEYRLTRQCLEVCAEFRVPVAIVTKSPLVTRDIDLLKSLSKPSVFFSLPFLTKEKSNPFEPYTPVPEARFRAMRELSDAGITTGIGIAPVIGLQRTGHSACSNVLKSAVPSGHLCRCCI